MEKHIKRVLQDSFSLGIHISDGSFFEFKSDIIWARGICDGHTELQSLHPEHNIPLSLKDSVSVIEKISGEAITSG